MVDEALPADDPAFILAEGVPYVRGWERADEAVKAFREVMRAAGLGDRWPYLRAEVTACGSGVAELGRVTPQTLAALTALVVEALAARAKAAEDGCAA